MARAKSVLPSSRSTELGRFANAGRAPAHPAGVLAQGRVAHVVHTVPALSPYSRSHFSKRTGVTGSGGRPVTVPRSPAPGGGCFPDGSVAGFSDYSGSRENGFSNRSTTSGEARGLTLARVAVVG